MEDRGSKRESLRRAFQLAYFIHGDRALAIRIVADALTRLEMALAAQDKRLYYTPNGRLLLGHSNAQRFRSKVSMSELHLLQRLVYVASERYERQQEQSSDGTPLDEDDMTIRFIKHLMRITVRRNSFHVTLGLSRLLYNYGTAETMELYSVLVQDPDRVRDDSYYRARKKLLMEELHERFGQFVKLIRGGHGEERFQAQENPGQRAGLVRKCLSLFTPWNTPCVVPDRFDPMRDQIRQLEFEGSDPDKEHPIEVNRMHTVLHPNCYDRLTQALRLDPPEQRLAIPHFFLSTDQSHEKKPPSDREHPPELTEEEITAIFDEVAERARQRKKHSAELLSILVDGIERARLDLAQTTRAQLEVEESAELIEVRAHAKQGNVLLAVYLLTHYNMRSGDRPRVSSITLEGGQKISFAVSASRNSAGDVIGALVDVTYRETNLVRAAWLLWRQLKYRLFKTAECAESAERKTRIEDGGWRIEKPEPGLDPRFADLGLTRSLEVKSATASLVDVKRVYIESLEDDPFGQSVRNELLNRLQASGRFIVTDNPDEADAALKGSVNDQVAFQLVNADGQVLWSRTGSTVQVVEELLADIQRLEGRGEGATRRRGEK
ncbi:MAG: hypothetical protein HY314_02340 [Acidobacteria bacterium]|nr:hypothetical protein [Acidobacteriota bacterium]